MVSKEVAAKSSNAGKAAKSDSLKSEYSRLMSDEEESIDGAARKGKPCHAICPMRMIQTQGSTISDAG